MLSILQIIVTELNTSSLSVDPFSIVISTYNQKLTSQKRHDLTRALFSQKNKNQQTFVSVCRHLSSNNSTTDPPGWDSSQGGQGKGGSDTVTSSGGGSSKKDKGGRSGGTQWSCPKCGNPCCAVERK